MILPTFLIRKAGKRISHRPTFLSEKSRQKNFAPNIPIYFGKTFEVPRDFSRKVPCVGVPRQTPQPIMLILKHGIAVFLKKLSDGFECIHYIVSEFCAGSARVASGYSYLLFFKAAYVERAGEFVCSVLESYV